MKIDFIVPYVDSNDIEWQKEYIKYSLMFKYGNDEFKKRYQNNLLFKYVFRGIAQYMPWINNVFLIVASNTQIPAWLNIKNVKIIYHHDFIPNKYLPTFNSNTIECFLHNIDELSEYFIYGNDDVYALNTIDIKDFFINNFPRNNIHEVNSENDYYSKKCFYMNEIIDNDLNLYHNTIKYYTSFHIYQPYVKSIYKNIYNHFEKQILSSISQFRNEQTLSQHFFSMYFVKKTNKKYINNNISHKYFNASLNPRNVYAYLKNPNDKLLCINNSNELIDLLLSQQMNKIFPNKSRYEL